MGQSAIPAAIAAKDPAAMRAAIVGELVPVIPAATDPTTWDPRELGSSGGNTWQAVIWQDKLWFRDETSIAAHDEISVITLLDGVNYLTNDIRIPASVLSRAVTTPPDPDDVDPDARPAYGDAYLVPAASSGDWADHEDEIAIWTAREWVYVVPSHGYMVYVEDELGFYHYTAADAWEAGLGAYSLPAGTVRPSSLLIRSWAFENQTTTAPPATGPAGEQYIIGTGATGAWSGHDGKIAWRPTTDAAFVITTPFTGEEGYDKNLAIRVKWTGSVWQSAAGALIGHDYAEVLASTAGTQAGSGGYLYDISTGPTQAKLHYQDNNTLSYTAKRAGAILRVRYQAEFGSNVLSIGDPFAVALVYDSVSACLKHERVLWGSASKLEAFEFVFAAPDALPHTYKIMTFYNSGGTQPITAFAHSRLEIEEFA